MCSSDLMLAAVFNAVSIVFVAWFQASGQGMPATLLTVGIMLLFFPAVWFGNQLFGFDGLVWAFPITQVFACLLGGVLFVFTGGAKVAPEGANDAIAADTAH